MRGALSPAEAERYFAELERLLEAQEPERGVEQLHHDALAARGVELRWLVEQRLERSVLYFRQTFASA